MQTFCKVLVYKSNVPDIVMIV